jgi:OOP family OmpA-OmpF porin
MMKQLSSLTGCGKDVPVDTLASGAAMADFVQTVLLTEQMDSDGDGVPDNRDACPGTPRGAPVDEKGCPKDSDGDGVYDYMDLCPDTPQGTPVDKNGCPLPRASKSAEVTAAGTWIYRDVQFEVNKAELRPSAYRVLDEIVELMEDQPNLRIEVQGHTDSTGARSYNQKLSERRAQSVVNYLKKEGIAANRMSAKGYGMDQPMDTNSTAEGRARNRRVEIKPLQ